MTDNMAQSGPAIRTYTFDVASPKKKKQTHENLKKPADSIKKISASAIGGKTVKIPQSHISADIRRSAQKTKSISSDRSGYRAARSPQSLGKANSKALAAKQSAAVKAKSKNPAQIHTIRALKNIPFPTAIICMSVICTILFMFMIISYVRINEYTIDVDKLDRKITVLTQTKKDLELDLEKKNDLRVIEKYATENLGMVKIDQLEKKYISIAVDDKIEIVKEKSGIGGSIGRFFEGLGHNFKDFLAYLG